MPATPRAIATTLAALAAALPVATASAGVITLDLNPALIATTGDTVLDARYRLSNTNWDSMLAKSSSISTSTIVSTGSLGNHNQLNNAAWDFTLGYAPSSGWSFALTHAGGGAPTSTSSTLTWSAPHGADATSPFRSFNALELFSVVGTLPASLQSAFASATNLAFSAPGHTLTGSLADVTSTGGLTRQWIYADFDLASTPFSLTGRLQHGFVYAPGNTSTSNLDERIKFDVKATTISLIPTPGAAALFGVGALTALRRRRSPIAHR
jgi:hypothetical protein